MAVGSRNLRPWSWPKQALFAAAFLLFSHLFYHDVILIWVIKAAACLLVVYVVIRTILRLTGKMEWDPVGGGGIITSTLFSATVVLFAGPVVLAITVGTMSVGAAFVRAMVEVPWSELSILSTFGVVAAAFMGLFAQRFLVLAFIEDPEQFQEAYLGIPLSFLVTHIAVGFAGFVVFPITIGAFLAGVFGLFFMPLFLSI